MIDFLKRSNSTELFSGGFIHLGIFDHGGRKELAHVPLGEE